jgi:hypothetical protein
MHRLTNHAKPAHGTEPQRTAQQNLGGYGGQGVARSGCRGILCTCERRPKLLSQAGGRRSRVDQSCKTCKSNIAASVEASRADSVETSGADSAFENMI